ncbi:MAG: M28 family peptidase [Acidobacteria bacterium]|nr:M28 family peptidase [Acidobacteriota bacterium]
MLTTLLACSLAASAQSPIRGFPADAAKQQRQWEQKFLALPEAKRIRTYMQRMSAEPHHAGSAGTRAVADYTLGLLKEWGLDARIENFEALLPYPASRVVEMIAPVRYTARLKEPVVAADSDSSDADQLPTYNAYSGSGDVTAPLVYVNYGLPDDYDYLKRQGIDVKGKIVIARYGKSWRGTKPKVAAERGAAACIIYSDPRDDGYFQGNIYPRGAFRPPQGVQRGSVMDMPLMVGDPLSPGWASEPGSKRLKIEEATSLMKIPVLPMSYEDASELLQQLGGPVAPEPWRGALGFTYHIGPGPATVRVKLEFDNSTRPVLNVVATIPGSEFPDQWIIYGNHHDAWVNGASDPVSGASALLETARGLAELRKSGWQPKRTIKLILWDAEEFGLIGSTEWAEKHKTELDRKLVAYINSDSNGKGRIGAGGVPSLEQFVAEILRELKDPVQNVPLIEVRREGRGNGSGSTNQPFSLSSLGAGSDYVAFVHHLGAASLNLGFGGESGGVYHSIYDSFHWYTSFSDSDFAYGRALSSVMGTLILRLSSAPLLPFEFPTVARTIDRYIGEITKEAGKEGARVDWKELRAELNKLTVAAKSTEADYSNAMRRWNQPKPERLQQLNELIYRSERAFLNPAGLPGRSWYRHQVSAPGMYTGYGAKTLPGIREAVEGKRWDEANQQLHELAKSLRTLQAELARISTALRSLND